MIRLSSDVLLGDSSLALSGALRAASGSAS